MKIDAQQYCIGKRKALWGVVQPSCKVWQHVARVGTKSAFLPQVATRMEIRSIKFFKICQTRKTVFDYIS